MKQVITELNISEGNTEGVMPLLNVLNHKLIINDPIETRVGIVELNGDNPNKILINKVNFINLISNRLFTLIVNSKMIVYTKQFSFMNDIDTIDLILIPRYTGITQVKYNCGFIKDIEEDDSSFYCVSDNIEYDSVLEDLIVEDVVLPDDILYQILGRDLGITNYDRLLKSLYMG